MVGLMNNNGVVPTPIPFTWVGEEHTVVIEATYDQKTGLTESFTGGTVKIYTDVGPATAGDYANQATFSDFTLVLSGVITDFIRVVFGSSSTFGGEVEWTGGSRLAELGANTTNFGMGGSGSTLSSNIPAGYELCWDGKIDEPEPVAVNKATWGQVKSLFN